MKMIKSSTGAKKEHFGGGSGSIEIAQLLYKAGEYKRAIDFVTVNAWGRSFFLQALELRAQCYYKERAYSFAVADLLKLTRYISVQEKPDLYLKLADSCRFIGQLQRALNVLKNFLGYYPEHREASRLMLCVTSAIEVSLQEGTFSGPIPAASSCKKRKEMGFFAEPPKKVLKTAGRSNDALAESSLSQEEKDAVDALQTMSNAAPDFSGR